MNKTYTVIVNGKEEEWSMARCCRESGRSKTFLYSRIDPKYSPSGKTMSMTEAMADTSVNNNQYTTKNKVRTAAQKCKGNGTRGSVKVNQEKFLMANKEIINVFLYGK